MKKNIKKAKNLGLNFIKHPLFSGSAIMVAGSNVGNFLAYLYHLIIGRMLGPTAYGELASFLATVGMISVTFNFLGLVIVKFVSAAEEKAKQGLYNYFYSKLVKPGVGLTLILLLLAPAISNFLHVDIKIALLIGPSLFLYLNTFIFRSYLQGILKFWDAVVIANSDILGRVIFGVVLVYLGFSSFGAVFGIFLAAVVSFLIGLYLLKEVRKESFGKGFKEGKRVLQYALPVLVFSLASNSFISTDVILTKHFFAAHDAGIYASLSTLGKIVFYGTAPISAVMFPLVSQRHSKGHSYKKILFLSVLMTVGIAGAVLLVYWKLPVLMVRSLYGEKFIEASGNLIWFGLFMSVFTLSNLIISFYLSIERSKISYIVPLFALMQIGGIIFMHNSIHQVIIVSLISASLLLGFLLIFFGYDSRQK